MAINHPKAGPNSVPAYQLSGIPYVTGSTGNAETITKKQFDFPYVTRFITLVNMNGTALYECAAAMFLAQAYGLELSMGVQFTIVVVALLTSIGVAGVPSASLVAIAIILGSIGLPVEAIGVLMVFDRILDMFRTSINIWGDIVCATIIARLSGEETNVSISQNGNNS